MQSPLDVEFESKIANNYVENHKEKLKVLYETVNKQLVDNKTKIINKLNENREDVPEELPDSVFVKSNFRSKQRNRFKKEKVLEINRDRKTLKPEVDKSKRGRKFEKIHMDNIKRPTKKSRTNTRNPVPGPSSSSNGQQ